MFNDEQSNTWGFGGHQGRPFQQRGQHPFAGPGGFRAGRGMVEPAILSVLTDKPMHGYEVISTLEEKSHGMWRPSAGSIYPTLQLMEEKGLVKSQEIDGKKVYTLTDAGKAAHDENAKNRDEMWEERMAHMNEFKQAREEFGPIMGALRMIMRKGTTEQKEAALATIREFRTAVEAIKEEKF